RPALRGIVDDRHGRCRYEQQAADLYPRDLVYSLLRRGDLGGDASAPADQVTESTCGVPAVVSRSNQPDDPLSRNRTAKEPTRPNRKRPQALAPEVRHRDE